MKSSPSDQITVSLALPRLLAVTSARHDGATCFALALSGLLANAGRRTLLLDLHPHRPEISAFLDLDESSTIYHLAHRAKLAPVTGAVLERHVRWLQGLAVLAGTGDPTQQEDVTDAFLAELLHVALAAFDVVVADLGMPRAQLPNAAVNGLVLWVLWPKPLGLEAFDRSWRVLTDAQAPWLQRVQVVLQDRPHSLPNVEDLLDSEYSLPVLATLPGEQEVWDRLEDQHSLEPFILPEAGRARFDRRHGSGAWKTRQALSAAIADFRPGAAGWHQAVEA